MGKLSKALFLMGTCLYVYRLDVGPAKPTEYAYSLAIYMASLYLLYEGNLAKLRRIKRSACCCVAIAVYSVMLATVLGLLRYGISFDRTGVRLFLKLILNILLFLVLYVFFAEDKVFFNRMAAALSIPLLAYAAFPFLPTTLMAKFVSGEIHEGRFLGFAVGPGAIGFAMTSAVSFIYVKWLDVCYRKSLLRFVYLILLLGCIMILVWTGCRLGVIAGIACILAGSIMFESGILRKRPAVALRKSVLRFASVVVVCGIFLRFLLPWYILEPFMERTFGIPVSKLSLDIVTLSLPYERLTNPDLNPRFESIGYYADLYARNPLGIGVNYLQRFGREEKGVILPPDSFLDTFMHGGILLVVAMIFLIGEALRNIMRVIRCGAGRFQESHIVSYLGASAAFVGYLVLTVFGGIPIYDMRFWIILAMCLAGLDAWNRGEVNQQRAY